MIYTFYIHEKYVEELISLYARRHFRIQAINHHKGQTASTTHFDAYIHLFDIVWIQFLVGPCHGPAIRFINWGTMRNFRRIYYSNSGDLIIHDIWDR